MAPGTISQLTFLLTPLREGRHHQRDLLRRDLHHFYSRPCGRGDAVGAQNGADKNGISTHAPAGGATSAPRRWQVAQLISTHAPAGGATDGREYIVNDWSEISTHAPAGGATETDDAPAAPEYISTHAPAGGATSSTPCHTRPPRHFYSRPCGRGDRGRRSGCNAAGQHFYSRPCGRGDERRLRGLEEQPNFYSRPCGRGDLLDGAKPEILLTISTHAPAGGATHRHRHRHGHQRISTHAPAGGATWSMLASHWPPLSHFYSRPCGRGDRAARCHRRRGGKISTHAPAGGATARRRAGAHLRRDFYSRPCGRGDPEGKGARCQSQDFYSRPCGRGDPDERAVLRLRYFISTHAPAGGATTPCSTAKSSTTFLLTPLREGRHCRDCRPGRGDHISTHAPAGGATATAQSIISAEQFLLTPLREGRQQFSTSPS